MFKVQAKDEFTESDDSVQSSIPSLSSSKSQTSFIPSLSVSKPATLVQGLTRVLVVFESSDSVTVVPPLTVGNVTVAILLILVNIGSEPTVTLNTIVAVPLPATITPLGCDAEFISAAVA